MLLSRLPEKLDRSALYPSTINEALQIFLTEGSGDTEALLDAKTPALF